jgi:DNA-binding NtrC family response regulator
LLPLRERPEDIVPLATVFARRFGAALARTAASRLLDYGWPGNVRELRAVIQRAAASARRDLGAIDIVRAIRSGSVLGISESRTPEQEAERQQLIALCRETGGSWRRLLELTGMSRTRLYRRLAAHGLRLRSFRFPTFSREFPGKSGKMDPASGPDHVITMEDTTS